MAPKAGGIALRATHKTNSPTLLRPIAWSALILLALEFGLEIRAYQRGYETLLFGQRKPVATDSTRNDGARWGPTDDFPFRSEIVDPPKPSNTVRIWIASASQAEDKRLPPDVVFPDVLQRHLNDRGIRAQVLNAGRAGRTIAKNQEDLERGAATWRPDVVVLYQMESGTLGGPGPGTAASDLEGPVLAQANLPRSAQPSRSWLTRTVEELTLYTMLKTNATSRLVEEKQLPESLDEVVVDDFAAAVERFVATAERVGARPVVSTIAISHKAGNLEQMPTQFRLARLRFDSSVSVAGWVDSIDRFNGRLHLIAQNSNLQLITLEEQIGGRPKFFRDPVHFTRLGHAEVGRTMANQLAEFLTFNESIASQ